MTPEQIRAAACAAFDAPDPMRSPLCKTHYFADEVLVGLDAVFRAGMEAGRSEAIESRWNSIKGDADGIANACQRTRQECGLGPCKVKP